MSRVCAGALLFGAVSMLMAQDRIPEEAALKYAKLFVKQAKIENPQIAVEPDVEKPYGFRAGEGGALAIPDKNLSEDTVAKATDKPVPVAQLWMRRMTLVVDEKAAPNDRLRLVTVKVNEEEHALPMFLVGASKKANGTLQLLIYGKDQKPLLSLPLEKIDGKVEAPVEIDGKKADDTRGDVTVRLLGKYQAKFKVAPQE